MGFGMLEVGNGSTTRKSKNPLVNRKPNPQTVGLID